MASISSLVLTGEHILVRACGDSPFEQTGVVKKRLVEPVVFSKPNVRQACWGEVLATGPHPYVKDDCSDKETEIRKGSLVIFPPTSGFQVPAPEGGEDEYRIMAASVVAGIIPGP